MRRKELAEEEAVVRKALIMAKRGRKDFGGTIEGELAKIAKRHGLNLTAKLQKDLIRWGIGYQDFDESVYYKDDKDYADGALGGHLLEAKRKQLNVLGEPLVLCNQKA